MKKIKFQQISFFILAFVVTSCWKQHDTLTISKDGTIKFITTTEIKEKGFTYADIKEISNEYVKSLSAAGWSIKKEWIKKESPFNMRFIGSGNITTIKNNSDFYRITIISDKESQIKFNPAESKGGKSSHLITLSGGSLTLIRGVSEIKQIDNVIANKTYTIRPG